MLHDVTIEKAIIRKEKRLEDDGDDEVIFKIEVAANRYDLLCLEGLARALLVFTGAEASLVFKLSSIPRASMLQMYVKPQGEMETRAPCLSERLAKFDQPAAAEDRRGAR